MTSEVIYLLNSMNTIDLGPSTPPPRAVFLVSFVADSDEQSSSSFQKMMSVVDLCPEHEIIEENAYSHYQYSLLAVAMEPSPYWYSLSL